MCLQSGGHGGPPHWKAATLRARQLSRSTLTYRRLRPPASSPVSNGRGKIRFAQGKTRKVLTGTKSRIFLNTKVQGLALPKEA